MEDKLRNEYKYVLSIADFARIESSLSACMERDSHARADGYVVRSLYFDSMWDEDLSDVLNGVLSKQKIRLRCYPPDWSFFHLEFKCKTGSDSVKRTISVSPSQARSLSRGDYACLMEKEETLAKELYARMKTGCYLPRAVVDYRRKAYLMRANDTRITFDYCIGVSHAPQDLFGNDVAFEPLMQPGIGVLEVKYSGFLYNYIKALIESVDALSQSNSKYVSARLAL